MDPKEFLMFSKSRKFGYAVLAAGFVLSGAPAFAAGDGGSPSTTSGSASPKAMATPGGPGVGTTDDSAPVPRRTSAQRRALRRQTTTRASTSTVAPNPPGSTAAATTPANGGTTPSGAVPGAPTTSNPSATK
jgi:hypothetical protein